MLFRRMFAYLIDLIVITIIGHFFTRAFPVVREYTSLVHMTTSSFALVSYVYFLFTEKLFSCSFGKFILGLRTVSKISTKLTWKQTSLRSILKCFVINALVFDLIPFIFAKDKKNTWLDRVTQSNVIPSREVRGYEITSDTNIAFGFFANPSKKFKAQVLLVIILVVVYFLGSILLRFTVGEPREIKSESMQPTISPYDRVIARNVYNTTRNYKRGDLVMFYSPMSIDDPRGNIEKDITSSQYFLNHLSSLIFFLKLPDVDIKRIVGLPGEEIEIKANKGVFINGQLLKTDYSKFYNAIEYPQSKIIIPKDSYFLLGDYVNYSFDSRYLGPVSVKRFCGVLDKIYMRNHKLVWESIQ